MVNIARAYIDQFQLATFLQYPLSKVENVPKMFCDFGVKTCNKFLSNAEYRQLDSKPERIRYALRRFDLNRLLQTSGKIILEHSRKNSKCSELAEHHLKCAETLFACTNNVKEQLEKAMKNASKVCNKTLNWSVFTVLLFSFCSLS